MLVLDMHVAAVTRSGTPSAATSVPPRVVLRRSSQRSVGVGAKFSPVSSTCEDSFASP